MATVKKNFPVLEMSCASCAMSVESMVRSIPGVEAASVNFASNLLNVEYDPVQVTPRAVAGSGALDRVRPDYRRRPCG